MKNCELVIETIQNELKSYIQSHDLKSLVLGVSGGIDSTLCAALARPVCDSLNIPLIGRSIPIISNKQNEIDRAKAIGNLYCHNFKEVSFNATFTGLQNYILEVEGIHDKISNGNIKARLRMIYLYNIAGLNKGMVLSTDNYTEYMLGYWTICGDVGDYELIKALWKTDVYDLARYIMNNSLIQTKDSWKSEALNACIHATPTAGLGVTNSDLDELGADSYEEVDKILKTWLTTDADCFCWDDYLYWDGRPEKYEDFVTYRQTFKDHPVVQRYIKSMFKREIPISNSRAISRLSNIWV